MKAEVIDRLLASENSIRMFREYRGMILQQIADAYGVTTSRLESEIFFPISKVKETP